jgi:hypothetical protein
VAKKFGESISSRRLLMIRVTEQTIIHNKLIAKFINFCSVALAMDSFEFLVRKAMLPRLMHARLSLLVQPIKKHLERGSRCYQYGKG